MANLSYAPSGSGPFAGAIGWMIFPNLLTSGSSTIVNSTLRDGSTINLTLSNIFVSGVAQTFNGTTAPTAPGVPFGSPPPGGYAGVTGNVALYTQASNNYNCIIRFSNIVVKDSFGVTIPNYTIVVCDAEVTGATESMIYTTNGDPWYSLGLIGNGTSPTYSGFGTTTLSLTNNGTGTFRSIVSATNSPSTVDVNINEGATPGREAIAFGIVLTKVNVSKVVNNRVFANDQFNFSVTSSTVSSSTITTGASNGVQPQSTSLYITSNTTANTNFTVNETLAPGSSSTLSTNYSTTILNTNTTPGGTIVPSTRVLGQSTTITFGDYILSTIVNTAITSTLTSTKSVDKSKALPGDTLIYTVVLNNLGPLTVGNITFVDTIPTGSSFVPNSVTLNGVTIPGSVAPPSGVNIGTIPSGSVSTVTFNVILQNNLSIGTTISNSAIVFGSNFLVPQTITISANSNTITSTILGTVPVSTTKGVDKVFADVGNILNYTVTIANNGNTTAFNIVFIDSIPNGTSLVSNSLKQDGINVAGSPNPPGVTLPNSIGPGRTSTVTFSVTVNTIPLVNPITNSASENFSYIFDITTTPNSIANGSANTNSVFTTINNASLSNIKYTDKNYAICGDIITYTISISNSGNVTATNVIISDTVPNGTSFVPGSIIANGASTGGNPSSINIGSINPGATSTVSFQIQVQC